MATPAEIAADAATAIAAREPQIAGTLRPRGRAARETGSCQRNPISGTALTPNALIFLVGVAAAEAAGTRGKLGKPSKTAPDLAQSTLIPREKSDDQAERESPSPRERGDTVEPGGGAFRLT